MKRDMELVRKIMFKLEELDGHEPFSSRDVTVEGVDPPIVGYHCSLLRDCGYILAEDSPVCGSGGGYFEVYIQRLTSAGHDFIDAARNETLWKKVIDTSKERGISLTVDQSFKWLIWLGSQAVGMIGG